jgi:hypothetical protein
MINTKNADTASKPSDDSTTSEKKLTTNNLNTTESTNAADSKGASSAAAVEEDVDMSDDIEIGSVNDVDEYAIDQSHVDGGADDDLQKVFAGRLPEDSRQGQRVEAHLDDYVRGCDLSGASQGRRREARGRAQDTTVATRPVRQCERAGADLASQVGPTRQKTQRMQRLSPDGGRTYV